MATNITYTLKLDYSGAVASVDKVTKSFTELDSVQQKFAKNAGKIAPKELDKYISDLRKLKDILGNMKPSFDIGKMAAQTTAQINNASNLLEQRLQQIQAKQVARMQSGFGTFTRIESTLASRTPAQRKADTISTQSDYKNKLEAENKVLKEQARTSEETATKRKKDEQELANFLLKQEEDLLAKMRGRWNSFASEQKQFEQAELARVAKLATDELRVKEQALNSYNQAMSANANVMKQMFQANNKLHSDALTLNADYDKTSAKIQTLIDKQNSRLRSIEAITKANKDERDATIQATLAKLDTAKLSQITQQSLASAKTIADTQVRLASETSSRQQQIEQQRISWSESARLSAIQKVEAQNLASIKRIEAADKARIDATIAREQQLAAHKASMLQTAKGGVYDGASFTGVAKNASTGHTTDLRATADKQTGLIKGMYETQTAYNQRVKEALALHEKTTPILQEQVRHHDSLVVRAIKLVSVYSLLNSVRQKFMEGLTSVPATGMELESTHAVFKAIFVTQKDIEEQFVFLDNLADRTGARLLSLQESFRDFAASAKFSGESMSNIHQIFNDITEAGTVLHLPADKMKSALVAINQMYAKGQVMMEELKRQLGNQLPAAVAVFARSLNLTTSQLMDKMKKGLIKPEDSVAGFAAMYKQIFASNDAFAIASQGINASIGRLDNEWTRLAQSIYKSTSTYMIGALKGFANSLQFVRENLGLIATVAGVAATAIGVHLVQAFTAYAVAAQTAAFATAGITTSVTSLSAVGAKLASIGAVALRWASWVGAVVAVGTAIYKVGEATVSVNGESVKLFDILKTGWEDAKDAAEAYGRVFTESDTWTFIKDAGTLIDKSVGALTTSFANQGLSKGWQKGFGEISRGYVTGLLENASGSIAGTATAQKTQAQIAEDRRVVAEQTKKDEASLALRKTLFEGTGEGMASEANQAMLSKNIELQTKISQSAIARIGNAVQMELKTLEVVKTGLDKKFARNEIAIIDYYNQQIDLLEKKYEIEHRGDVAKLELMKQEEARRRGFEENLISMEAQTKELKIQEDLATKLSDALTKGGDKPLIFQFNTAEEERNQHTLTEPTIEANRKAYREVQLAKEMEAYKTSHEGSMLGYKQSVDTLAGVPLTTNTEALTKLDKTIKDLQKTYNEDTKKVVQANLAMQEHGQYSANVESDINNLVSATLGKLKPAVDQWDSLIAEKSAKANIPANFLKGLVGAESMGNKKAVSSAGAAGLVQFMPATGQRYGMTPSERFDPAKNLEGSAKYVSDIAKALGIDIWKATEFQLRQIVTAYNSGEGSGNPKSKHYQHRQDILAGKFNPAGKEEGNRVVAYMQQMGDITPVKIPMSEVKGEGAVNKAITGQLISNNALKEQELAIESKILTQKLEIQVLEDTRKAAYLDFVENLQKTTLEFKAQEGTISELERTNLIDLGTAKQKRQLNIEEGKAKLAILDTSGRISEEERKAAKIALELIPLAKQQLEIDKQRVALKEQINRKEATNSAKASYEDAASQNLPMAQASKMGISGNFIGAFVTQEAARAKSDTLGTSLELSKQKLALAESTTGKGSEEWFKVRTEIEQTTTAMNDLALAKDAVINQAVADSINMIGDSFISWANGAQTAKEAFRSLAIDFAKMIQEMIMNELKMMAVKGIMSMITGGIGGVAGGGGGGGGGGGAASGGSIDSFATGGQVSGKGTGTSDSIPAIVSMGSYVLNAHATAKAKKHKLINLSHGEVVISPEQVAQLGLDTLNTMNMQGYATGGLVGGTATSSSSKPTGKNSNVYNINVAVPEGTSNPQQFGKDTGTEIYKAIAREEAKREINRYNKMKTGGR